MSVITDILEVEKLFAVNRQAIRHFNAEKAFDLVSGAAASTMTIVIPDTRLLLISNIYVEGYAKDGAGNYDFAGRKIGSAFFDTVSFQWKLNGEAKTPITDHQYYKGQSFLVFPSGSLVLSITYVTIAPVAVDQRLYVKLNGYMITSGAKSGEQAAAAAAAGIVADLGQSAQQIDPGSTT